MRTFQGERSGSPEGFESPTFGFEVCLKNLLGYGEIPVFRGKSLVFL